MTQTQNTKNNNLKKKQTKNQNTFETCFLLKEKDFFS